MRKITLLIPVMLMIVAISQSAFAQFSAGNLVVYRVGDGTAALTNASTPVFLDEYSVTGTLVQSFPLPTTGSYRLTASGTSTAEGHLTLSPDGNYLTVPGYDAATGIASISGSQASVNNRRVLRVDYASNYFALSSATAFNAQSIRGGVSSGNDYWATGGTSGVQYFGTGTAATVSSTPSNLRVINIYNGQLYFSTGSNPAGIYIVGTGTPTTGPVTPTALFATGTGSSPYGFAINSSVTVCYVADDAAATGGVQKWTYSGSAWTKAYTIAVGTTGARGLTVNWSGANPVIYATTTNNRLIKIEDIGASSTVTDLATAGTNTALRGVAFAPAVSSFSAPTVQTSNFTFSNILQTQMNVGWTNGNGSKRVVKINTSNSFTAPADGTDPAANTVYGGSGEQVVYNGTGNSLTVTGLTAGITYWFQAWEYNGAGATTLYCTATGTDNPKSQTTQASTIPPIMSTPTATSITATSAILGGTIVSDGGSAILERGTVWSLTSPVTIADNKLAEGNTATGAFSHLRNSLPSNTTIYYAAYATNSAGTTLTTEASFLTLLGEPSNHVTSFTAVSPIYNTIVNTWNDNDGAVPATGYLIMANTTGVFTDPVDGVQAASDASLADGSGLVYVNHGIETYSWTGLPSSSQYYFAIYPYTNSGTNINYKTDPVIPAANTTTQVFVAPVAAWTFDATAGSPSTPTSDPASFGDQAGTAMLYADGTNGSSSWLQATELNAFGGTTLNDPREPGVAIAGNSYCLVGGTGNSANGKSIVLKFSMAALENPVLSFATRNSSASAFTTHQWAWSIDGTSFTDFGTNTAPTSTTFSSRSLDMSAINDLDGATTVYLRLTVSGSTSATANNRLDNVTIRATAATNLPPTVVTTAATLVQATTATINGTVNANNQSTDVTFEYGTQPGVYGAPIAATPATVTGGTTTGVSADLTGLSQNATYYFRVNGSNLYGTSHGLELSFTTGCLPAGDAGPITGPTVIYADGVTPYTFSVAPITNASNYIWSFPTSTTIISGEGTNQVSVVFGGEPRTGYVYVYGTNPCDEEGGSSSLALTIFALPYNQSVSGFVGAGNANCYNATNIITVAGGGTTFEIDVNGAATMKAGQKILYLPNTIVHQGGYMLGIIVPNGPYCSGDAPVKDAENTTATTGLNGFRIYPNPTTGTFTLEQTGSKTGTGVVEILGTLGGKVLSTALDASGKQEISIKGQPQGVYFVRVSAEGRVQTLKVILVH